MLGINLVGLNFPVLIGFELLFLVHTKTGKLYRFKANVSRYECWIEEQNKTARKGFLWYDYSRYDLGGFHEQQYLHFQRSGRF